MLPDQVLLANARMRCAGLIQPLDVVQAQPLRFRTLLICITQVFSGFLSAPGPKKGKDRNGNEKGKLDKDSANQNINCGLGLSIISAGQRQAALPCPERTRQSMLHREHAAADTELKRQLLLAKQKLQR